MEAYDLVRLFINKTVVPVEPVRRGNPGYGSLRAVRLLVYSRQVGLENDTRIVEHLKRRHETLKALGFRRVPNRTTIGRLETLRWASRRGFWLVCEACSNVGAYNAAHRRLYTPNRL